MVEVEIMNAKDDLELAKIGAKRLGEYPGRLDRLEELIGHPPGEHTKPLVEIVAALNKELLSLKEEIKQLKDDADRQSKKLQDEIDRRHGWVR